MSIVSNVVKSYLPYKTKATPSGWMSFNAPCCHHNGHKQDKRSRGGLIFNENEGVSYHCFNCGFKCSWTLGRHLSSKFKNFLYWLGASDDVVNKLALDLLRENNTNIKKLAPIFIPEFLPIDLPINSVLINTATTVNSDMLKIIEYIATRNLNFSDTDFYWSNHKGYKDRLIIPFYYNNRIVGFTARSITDKAPKYLTNSQPGYVFGLDKQKDLWNYVIVCEGPIDALKINGLSILGSELSKSQIELLSLLGKEIIIIPDRDGAGKKLYKQALELNWSVSFPNWSKDIKDVSDAVDKYGRLLTIHSIIQKKQTNNLKIKLGAKKWFG
jgi:hypothetical protein